MRLEAESDLAARWVVFIGDLVDRGPDPRGVVESVLRFRDRHPQTAATMGNHELALAAALGLVQTPVENHWPRRYVGSYDSGPTFSSYGAAAGDLHELRENMPAEHKRLLASLPWCVEHPQYLFVHAGLLPDRPFAEQVGQLRARDFSHNRPPWLCKRTLDRSSLPPDCPVTVVSGHVPRPQVEFRDSRILMDTSGGYKGSISAVMLPERRVITA